MLYPVELPVHLRQIAKSRSKKLVVLLLIIGIELPVHLFLAVAKPLWDCLPAMFRFLNPAVCGILKSGLHLLAGATSALLIWLNDLQKYEIFVRSARFL
jgi:hypothetical protein